jgi:hypothetical protein
MKYVNLIANAQTEIAREREVVKDCLHMQGQIKDIINGSDMYIMLEAIQIKAEKSIKRHQKRLDSYFRKI